MAHHLNSQTEAALRRAGWTPGRQVETWPYEADYGSDDFPDFAQAFLREFGHLKLQADPKPENGQCDVWFNTVFAARAIGGQVFDDCCRVANQRLAPVGEFNRYDEYWYSFSYFVLLLGENGKFYLSVEDMDNLYLVGNDLNELYDYQLGIREPVALVR